MKTFNDVIALWGSLSELAADLDIPYGVVKQWRRRGSVPADRWVALIGAAQRRGFDSVSADVLAEMAHTRPSPSTPTEPEPKQTEAA